MFNSGPERLSQVLLPRVLAETSGGLSLYGFVGITDRDQVRQTLTKWIMESRDTGPFTDLIRMSILDLSKPNIPEGAVKAFVDTLIVDNDIPEYNTRFWIARALAVELGLRA